jgi:isoquinoline 1-oxidoreductase beta subunit
MIVTGVAASGGLAIAWGLSRFDDGDARAKFAAATPDRFVLNAYVKIARDGRVAVAMPMAELGQGVATAGPMLVAEELDADWSMVSYEMAPLDKDYGSYVIAEAVPVIFMKPGMFANVARWALYKVSPLIGMTFTGGSSAIFGNYNHLRMVGAAAREMLKTAAANQWGVAPSELSTERGRVIHRASNRSANYGELAEAAARLTPPDDPPLKDPKDFTILTKPLGRLDTPEKVDGSARFGIDVRLPNMAYAAIRHAPVFGSKVASFDAAPIKARKGVIDVVKAGDDCVAVVADNTWSAEQAVRALDVTFEAPAGALVDTATLTAGYRTKFDAPDAAELHAVGDAKTAFAVAAKTLEADYETPYLAHVCMEPMNCTALYEPAASGKPEEAKVTVWSPSQSMTSTQWGAAKIAGVPDANVTVHNVLMGGGFGRRADLDFMRQVVRIAMQLPNRPIKLTWSREQDVRHDTYRPAGVARFKGALDNDGNLTALDFLIVAKTVSYDFGTRNDSGFQMEPREDAGMVGPMNASPYAIPNLRLASNPQDNLVPSGNWRAVANSHNGFYQESFIDECALAAGKDPVAFRRTLLKDKPQHLAVLDGVAEKAGWGTAMSPGPNGEKRGRGVSLLDMFGTTVGQVVEVSVGESGDIKVDRVVSVVDPHTVVNPGIVAAQIESAVHDGLSAALYGKVEVKAGQVVNGNFDDYRMMRLADAPTSVETHVMPQGGHPGGIGEVGLPGVAPALCNAIFAATGRRIRSLPLVPAAGGREA